MLPLSFKTPRTARYLLLGEPGPAIGHVWVCLHGHGQAVADLAKQLQNLDTPEQLLVLPEALSRYDQPESGAETPVTHAAWFATDSLLADFDDLGIYLDDLTRQVLAACPPDTPLTVLGYGHGAAAACRWLANNGTEYVRLILYAPVFPAEIDRRATLVALPEHPVLVVSTTADTYTAEAADEGLMQDLLDVGLSAQQRLVDAAGPLPLAVLAGSPEA